MVVSFVLLSTCCLRQEYNATTLLEGKKLSRTEMQAILVVNMMSPAARQCLEYHWSAYKPATSGVTVSRIDAIHDSITSSHDECCAFIKNVLLLTADKIECVINHHVGVFNNKLNKDVRA